MDQTNGEQWGVFDTVDNCWLGDDKGPKLFSDEHPTTQQLNGARTCAKICAQITAVRLDYNPARLQPRLYTSPATKLRDEVKTKVSAAGALKAIEDGHLSAPRPFRASVDRITSLGPEEVKTAPRPRIQVLTWHEHGDDDSTTRVDAYSGDDKTDTWNDEVKLSILLKEDFDPNDLDSDMADAEIEDYATVHGDVTIHDGDIIETKGRKFKVTITEVTEGDKS